MAKEATAKKLPKKESAIERARKKLEAMKKQTSQGGGGDFPFDYMAAFPEGKTVIRVFGPWQHEGEEVEDFYRELSYHRDIGEEKATLLCPKSVDADADCPLCEAVEELRAKAKKYPRESDKNKRLWNESNAIKAKPRFFMNVVRLKNGEPVRTAGEKAGEPAEKPEVLGCGSTIIQAILGYYTDEDADTSGAFWKEGQRYDFIIERTGTGKNDTEYAVKTTRKYADTDTSEIEAECFDLDDVMGKPKSAAQLRAILTGEEIEEEEEEAEESEETEAEESEEAAEEEDEKPAKKIKKGHLAAKDDEEEEEAAEEEEEDERPAKKKAKKPADEEEETEEAEEEEEAADEEDEKPAKGKKPVCFGESDDYDPKDATCKACKFRKECVAAQEESEPEEAEEEAEEVEEEEAPAKKKVVSIKKKAKPADEEEEEEASEEEEEEADEEIEKKMKTALAKKKAGKK